MLRFVKKIETEKKSCAPLLEKALCAGNDDDSVVVGRGAGISLLPGRHFPPRAPAHIRRHAVTVVPVVKRFIRLNSRQRRSPF